MTDVSKSSEVWTDFKVSGLRDLFRQLQYLCLLIYCEFDIDQSPLSMLEAGPMPIGIFVESFNSDSTIQQSLSATARLSSCWMSKLDANFCYIIYLPSFQWSTNSTKRKWCPSTSSRATRLFSNATFPHSSQISSKWMPGWRLMARSICRGPTSVLVTSVDPNHICTNVPSILRFP